MERKKRGTPKAVKQSKAEYSVGASLKVHMAGKIHVEGAIPNKADALLLDLANSYRLHVLQAETQMDMSAACGAYVVPEAQEGILTNCVNHLAG